MPTYKNYNEKVDLISGRILDKNQKSCGYERYTEAYQGTKTGNQTYYPQDQYVHDPITGRNIIRR